MASRSWNRVELIGNLTRDPELRYTPNGAAVASFGIATNRSFVVDGERREEVDFHRLVAWNKLAELCNQLLKKGARVFIAGRLQYREWETQDGQKKKEAEIVVEDMILLTSRDGVMGKEETMEESVEEKPKAPVKEVVAEKVVVEESTAEEKPEPEAKPSPAKVADESVADEDLPF